MTKFNTVYINHFDCISCAGDNSLDLFESICLNKNTLTLDEYYVPSKISCIGKISTNKTFDQLLYEKCLNVLNNSSLQNFDDTLLIVGSSVGGMLHTENSYLKNKDYKNIDYKKHMISSIAVFLQEKFSFRDDVSFSTACTSSANALAYAKEVINKGIYKNVLVVGIDSLSHTTVCGFSGLSVLSSEPCKPFDKNRNGMNVSEAIAVLLLQDKKEENSLLFCGVGYSSDAHHMTQPHPEGKGAKRAMQNALFSGNIDIKDVDYINAHGTGTKANDASETAAIHSLFKNYKPYVCSTKSITGHTLGASGALEAIITCIVLQKQIITPNNNLNEIENNELNFPLQTIEKKVSYALSNSFAFGGNNTSLLFGLC